MAEDTMVIGTVVVCLSCKRVVWAYDGDYGDLRGVCNCFQLPCLRCGAKGNFDGWRITTDTMAQLDAYDAWSTMHKLTEGEGYEWDPTGDNRWPVSGPDPKFLRAGVVLDDMPEDREEHYNRRAEEMP